MTSPPAACAACFDHEEGCPPSRVPALVRLTRPRQWIKNLAVCIVPGVERLSGVPVPPGDVYLTIVVFTLASAAEYCLNDVCDRESDRAHPDQSKRCRPVAAGEVSVPLALAAGAGLAVASLLLAAQVSLAVAGLIGVYGALNAAYSLGMKRTSYLEMISVASGFVLRVLTGAVAAHVSGSLTLFVGVLAVAMCLVAGKRRGEKDQARAKGVPPTRFVLTRYRDEVLGRIQVGATLLSGIALFAWADLQADKNPAGRAWLLASVIPVVIVLVGFVRKRDLWPKPDELVDERWVQLLGLGWFLLVVIGVRLA